MPNRALHSIILHNIIITDWYYVYYIKYYGLSQYTKNALKHNIINMDGIQLSPYT
jgi:hypothetical protein